MLIILASTLSLAAITLFASGSDGLAMLLSVAASLAWMTAACGPGKRHAHRGEGRWVGHKD